MFSKTKEAIKGSIEPSRKHIADARQNLHERVDHLKQGRTLEAQQALEQDFAQVLEAWGMSEAEIPTVQIALRMRCLAFAMLLLLVGFSAALSGGALFIVLAALMIYVACFFGVATTFWRIWVLKHRHFVPFRTWLFTISRQKLLQG